MTDSLESELDQLFQLAPSALVEARSALADRLKKAGQREAAARIKGIKRPSPAAWSINQVFFQQPLLLTRALTQAQRVRELHARDGVDVRQLSSAVEAQRVATRAVVEVAMKLAEAAGQSGGATLQRRILTTLQGWLTGVGDEPPGRMTHELEPSGFDAVAQVGTAAPRALPTRAEGAGSGPVEIARPEPSTKKQRDPARLVQAAAALAQREQEASAARELLAARRATQLESKAELEQAQSRVREAESALHELRVAQQQREAELGRAQAALTKAQAAARGAEEAVTRAHGEHARLLERS